MPNKPFRLNNGLWKNDSIAIPNFEWQGLMIWEFRFGETPEEWNYGSKNIPITPLSSGGEKLS